MMQFMCEQDMSRASPLEGKRHTTVCIRLANLNSPTTKLWICHLLGLYIHWVYWESLVYIVLGCWSLVYTVLGPWSMVYAVPGLYLGICCVDRLLPRSKTTQGMC